MTDFQTNGMQIVKRIDDELDFRGETRVELAKYLGINPQNISAWYTRGTVPAGDICLRISEYLGISIEYLIYGKEPESTQEERKLLKQWHALSSEEKNFIQIFLDGCEKKRNQEEKNSVSKA